MKSSDSFSVAICMATYNGEKYLYAQLDSLFAQTYTNFKLYICDDCSLDSTFPILETYKKRYPDHIVLTANAKNIGTVKNFENLISSCTETYIALCDQDDVWLPHKLLDELKAIVPYSISKPVLVHSDLQMVDSNLSVLHESYFNYRGIVLDERKTINKIIGHNGVMGCTVLMNQALKNKALPFPQGLDVHDYWLAIVNEICGKRVTLQKPLIQYRIHESNTSNTRTKMTHNRTFIYTILNKDILPFRGLNREVVLKSLIKRFKIDKNDTAIIDAFIDYLENKKNPFFILYKSVKYDLFRNNTRYRIKVYLKILFS